MRKKKCVAMLLAGGQGSRLGLLTKSMAKPAVPFGGRYRIIDFPLSNCSNSHIDTVGVLTQYQPMALNRYIGSGQPWDLDLSDGGVFVLPPYMRARGADWYRGTANAVYQNFAFISQYDPDYVLVLSGDHIYRMDYNQMLEHHISRGADVTIAVRPVPMEDAPSFGIMTADDDGRVLDFEEKPQNPKSNLASMGVYIFSWPVMYKYLTEDAADPKSENDFGKNIIPNLLGDGMNLMAYPFREYWKDVGTIESLWEANMDLLRLPPELDLDDPHWPIYARSPVMPPHFVGTGADIRRSFIGEGCEINGYVSGSVVSTGCYVEAGAKIIDSVVMPGAQVLTGAVVERAILGEECVIGRDSVVGGKDGSISLIGPLTALPAGTRVSAGLQVDNDSIPAKEDA